jgi:DNA adenine methylase
VGGGSVLRQLLESDIKVNKYICSDICKPLIDLWNKIKLCPNTLYDSYKENWLQFQGNIPYYYEAREKFNKDKNPFDFLFILRTCVNGVSRFNSKGDFNSACHNNRPGIKPESLKEILYEWSDLLNKYKVQFIHQDYKNIQSQQNDVLYCDPPYANTTGLYYGCLDYNEFWKWLREQKGFYVLSFDGISGNDNRTYNVSKDIYSKHIYIDSGVSSFKKLNQIQEYVKESLYIK